MELSLQFTLSLPKGTLVRFVRYAANATTDCRNAQCVLRNGLLVRISGLGFYRFRIISIIQLLCETLMSSEFYKFKGKVHLWKYLEKQSNYPGINLTADTDGCASLIELLTRFRKDEYQPTKTLALHPTTKNIARVGTAKSTFKSFSTITLNFISEGEPIWTIEEQLNDEIKISFSLPYLKEFENALKRVKVDEGDFPIADKKRKHVLYFWWYLDK